MRCQWQWSFRQFDGNHAVRFKKGVRARPDLMAQPHHSLGKSLANDFVDSFPEHLPADPPRVQRIPDVQIPLGKDRQPIQEPLPARGPKATTVAAIEGPGRLCGTWAKPSRAAS